MNNTLNIDFNNKTFQDTAVKVMNDILSSDVSGSNMDDLHKKFCEYVNIKKEKFLELYKQAEEQLSVWKKTSSENCDELTEDELEMVCGGGLGSFLCSIGEGIATAACATGNFVKEHAVEIGIVAGSIAFFAATGGAFGALQAYLACSSIAGGALFGAAFMGGIGGVLCGLSLIDVIG